MDEAVSPESIYRMLLDAISVDDMLGHIRAIHENDRWFSFEKLQASADYCRDAMRASGLGAVELTHDPADGETTYWDVTMPLAWDAEEGVLEIVEPVGVTPRVLADYRQVPLNLIGWCAPTPRDGVEGELVEITRVEDVTPAAVKGRLVLTDLPPEPRLRRRLTDSGVLGLVS